MNAINWPCYGQQCLESTLSLTDVRKKLFPTKTEIDRGPVASEDKYTPKTLVGNWFEHRAIYVPQSDDWRTIYETDYKFHTNKTWEINQNTKWNNKLNLEGVPQEILFDHRKEYYSNMTTTYDLCYNILMKGVKEPRIRSYNARQKKWIPEQDLMKSFGTLTQFGLRDIMKEEIYKNSKEGIAKCQWWSTYAEEIGQLKPANVERITKRKVNFNVPDLKHFKQKLSDIERCSNPFKMQYSKSNAQDDIVKK
ncbi:Cilia- and flagella-associated protein 107 [Anthophora retusa]